MPITTSTTIIASLIILGSFILIRLCFLIIGCIHEAISKLMLSDLWLFYFSTHLKQKESAKWLQASYYKISVAHNNKVHLDQLD